MVGRCFETVIGSRLGWSGFGSQISRSVTWPISVNWWRVPSILRLRISATVTAFVIDLPCALSVRTPRVVGCFDDDVDGMLYFVEKCRRCRVCWLGFRPVLAMVSLIITTDSQRV